MKPNKNTPPALATALGAFVITLVAVSFQAFKTAFGNPVDSLKSE